METVGAASRPEEGPLLNIKGFVFRPHVNIV